MKKPLRLFNLFFIIVALSGCNTLYHSRTINIEILQPGRFKYSGDYKKVAVHYNNSNVSFNKEFAKYVNDENVLTDPVNTDSISSEIYFNTIYEHLRTQKYFDTVFVLKKTDYSNFNFSGELLVDETATTDSGKIILIDKLNPSVLYLSQLIKTYLADKEGEYIKKLDPEFGLLTKEELKKIADTTGADLLLSLDFFAQSDGSWINMDYFSGTTTVLNFVLWNFFDLKKPEPSFYYDKTDTILWGETGNSRREIIALLPPRKDAVFNAADISGTKMAEILIPHWTEVSRRYYYSGHPDMKKTELLIKEGKWQEAAEIWKANINNPNKFISAKSMYNLGVACEMSGDMEAAIDWVVKSYQVFGNKNEIHAFNCTDYLKILGQRKLDIKKLDVQLNQEIIPEED